MSSDRQGQLRLDLFDVNGKRVGGRVDVRLRHQVLSHNPVFNGLDASKRIMIKDLFAIPQGLYLIEIDPSAYLGVSHFINIEPSGITDLPVTVPIDPRKVKDVNFPEYKKLPTDLQTLIGRSDKIMTFEGRKGAEVYDSLDDLRKAGLLNIGAKCAATRLSNGKTVLPYIDKITELRGERFFASVPRELREEAKNSVADGLFRPVSEVLHTPPAGFSHAGSFKTMDKYGNLQLSFFSKGDEWAADIDIDPASGLEHLFQVLEHELFNRHSHPYDIHEILIARQQIDPGYNFVI